MSTQKLKYSEWLDFINAYNATNPTQKKLAKELLKAAITNNNDLTRGIKQIINNTIEGISDNDILINIAEYIFCSIY